MKNYILGLLPEDKMARILDIGCGDGTVIRSLVQDGYTGCSGVDIDENSIRSCRDKGLNNCELIKDLGAYLAAKKEVFDVINLREVLYYFPDDKLISYLELIRGALKPGGTIIIEVFNGSLLAGPFFKYKDYKIRQIFTEHSLRAALQDAHFNAIKVSGIPIDLGTIKRIIWQAARVVWIGILSMIYTLELGSGGERPTIWTNLIVAAAKR